MPGFHSAGVIGPEPRRSAPRFSGGAVSVMRKAAKWAPLASGVLFAAMSGSGAEPITLRVHTFNSPKAIVNLLFLEPWAKEIAARSDGRVRVQVFPAMQLGGRPADLYGQARDGVVDLVWTLPGYSPRRFPLTEVFELPFVCGDAEATSQALMTFHRKWMRDEYRDTHPLVFHATAPGQLHTVDRLVRTIKDLEGLKVRAASQTVAAMLEALGAVPVGMPVPQVYEALARGRRGRRHGPLDHHAAVPAARGDALPHRGGPRLHAVRADDEQGPLRRAPRGTSGGSSTIPRAWRWPQRLGRIWQEDEEAGRDIALQRGHPVIALAEAERARWRAATAPVVDAWVAKVDAMGYDGRALLADARRLTAGYADCLDPVDRPNPRQPRGRPARMVLRTTGRPAPWNGWPGRSHWRGGCCWSPSWG